MSPVSTPAVVLRSFPYGETSLILRFYTLGAGVMGVMAKGARKRGSRGSGTPDTFTTGVLTVYVKASRDLQTMKDFAPEKARRALGRDLFRFAGASVLGELVLRHAGEEGNATLFHLLDHALDRVVQVPEEVLLPEVLALGWSLVDALGYRPVLEACTACGRSLEDDEMGRFDMGAGGLRCPSCPGDEETGPRVGPEARRQLRTLLAGEPVQELRRPRAHVQLLNDFVTWHVSGGRPLRSFRIFTDLLESRET